jgi:hypothetical protein
MSFLCKVGFHEWKYLPWPRDLNAPINFVLGTHHQARTCLRCNKIQIPEHNCAYENIGDWHWKTIQPQFR